LIASLFFIKDLNSDSFTYNSFNNHGVIGLINMPTARMYDESSYSFNYYYGEKDQKISMTAYPFEWLEASVFYSNLNERDWSKGIEFDGKVVDNINVEAYFKSFCKKNDHVFWNAWKEKQTKK